MDFGSPSEVSPEARPGTGPGGNGATELREPETAKTWSLQLRGLQGQRSELRNLPCEMLGSRLEVEVCFFFDNTFLRMMVFFDG